MHISAAKRFKTSRSSLETLPNELLLEVFGYLTSVDIVWAFSGLNQRLRDLIVCHCDTFDFKATKKAQLDYASCRYDVCRWRALRLVDDDETPGQIPYFCQRFPLADKFTQLEALTLMNTKPSSAACFQMHLSFLTNLVSLTIGSICGKTFPVLDLLNLKHLVICSCMDTTWMQHLRLETLQHTFEYHCKHESKLAWPATTKQLKVSMTKLNGSTLVRTALKSVPQLVSFTIFDGAWESSPPDGQVWQKLITSSLPLLQSFKFYFKFWRDSSCASDVNHIISTFSTPFYLQEKSWFIRCDFHRRQISVAALYSLPFAFEQLETVTHSFNDSLTTSASSSSKDQCKRPYKDVRTLVVSSKCEEIDRTLLSENILNLSIVNCGVLAAWIFTIPTVRRLSIGSQSVMSPAEFLRLLRAAPRLTSLAIPYSSLSHITDRWKNQRVCDLLSRRIRSLHVSTDNVINWVSYEYAKVDELLPIVRVFGERCRHLTIAVYSRNVVAGLILRCMTRLRSLKVHLHEHSDDQRITKEWLLQQDAMFEDLDCSIVADRAEYSFWFGHRANAP